MDSMPRAWMGAGGALHRTRAYLHRFGLHPGGSWALSWLALCAGGLALDAAGGPLESSAACVLRALFAGLTWVGALAFAGRRAPLWILPAAFGLGLARAALTSLAGPSFGALTSLAYEPAAILAASFVVWRSELLVDQLTMRLALTGSLFAVALFEIADGLAPVLPGIPATKQAWMVLAPIAGCCEVGAMWSWIARRELRIERAEDERRELEGEVARERRANQLLRQKEAWLFDFFEKAPDMLLVLAPRTCEILRCNRRFSETLGRPRRDLVGRRLVDLVAAETANRIEPILQASRRRVRNLRLHFRRQDGSDLVVLANLALRVGPDGANEIRGVLHDVTGLDRPSVPSRRELQRLLDQHVATGLFHADPGGRCAIVNASFCELTGLTPERAAAQTWLDCIHGQDRRRVESEWERSVRDRSVFRVEHRVHHAREGPIRVLTECTPIADDPIGGFAGSMTRLGAFAESSVPTHRPAVPVGPRPGS